MRLFATAFILLISLAPHAVWGQTAPAAAPAPAAALTPAQAQAVLDVLKDDKKRADFTAVLENMVHAIPEAAPAKPSVIPIAANSVAAQLLVQGANWATSLASQITTAVQAVGDVPLLWRWAAGTAEDPAARGRIFSTLWKLVVIFAIAMAVEWGVGRVLAGFRRILATRAPADEGGQETDTGDQETHPAVADHHRRFSVAWRMLRRLPFVLAALVLDLVPVAAFAAVGNVMLATPLGDTTNARLVVLAVVNAYVICRVVMCITRTFVSPTEHRLRLIQCDDEAARYIERWVRRLSGVAVFGFATAEVGLLFGLYQSAHDVLTKLVGLVVHIMLVIVVLQTRQAVAHRLRARKRSTGVLASLQNHLAAHWHLVAIFYIVALWLVAATEIHNGYERLLHFFIVTMAVIIAARLVSIVALGTLDRVARIHPETSAQYPGLEQRLTSYYPIIRLALMIVLLGATAVALFEVWGLNPVSWFTVGQLGAQLLAALTTSAITIVIAVVVWEVANAAVENKVATLTRAAQTARAARLRTLLPMLRTGLLVTILIIAGLIVLSQIGVNIAPLLAGAGVLGVAIGFGSQKLVQDLITGLFLLLENTMQVGDVVTLASLSGTVEYLSIRTIRLRAVDGSVHIIPFSSVTTVTNQTRDFAYALMDLPIGLNEEPDRIADLLRDIVKTMRDEPRWQDAITADLEVMGVFAFTDTAWTMRVRIRTTPSQRWAVNREFNRRVKYCFDENAVQSPITAYKVQGWLPPGAERPMPKPAPEPEPKPPMQDAAQ
jgi:small-conductance mechanosensitive channel